MQVHRRLLRDRRKARGRARGRARRLHERGQDHAAQPAHRRRPHRRRPALRHARSRPRGWCRARPHAPVHPHRHRRLHPQAAAPARGGLQGHAGGAGRGRRAACTWWTRAIPALDEQMAAVEALLGELELAERPTVVALNKVDRLERGRRARRACVARFDGVADLGRAPARASTPCSTRIDEALPARRGAVDAAHPVRRRRRARPLLRARPRARARGRGRRHPARGRAAAAPAGRARGLPGHRLGEPRYDGPSRCYNLDRPRNHGTRELAHDAAHPADPGLRHAARLPAAGAGAASCSAWRASPTCSTATSRGSRGSQRRLGAFLDPDGRQAAAHLGLRDADLAQGASRSGSPRSS